MNDRLSESAKKQEAARRIRATLVELWNVAKLGGLDEAAKHLENAIAEADRVVSDEGGMASQTIDKGDTRSREFLRWHNVPAARQIRRRGRATGLRREREYSRAALLFATAERNVDINVAL